MASVSNYNNIKIDYLSKLFDNSSEQYNTKSIVFPVLRYKIFAPVVEGLKLNVFQKTVLLLLNKGNFDIQKISSLLNLDTQLVQIILSELSQKNFVNNGEITKNGREFIEGRFSWFDNADNLKKDIHYIYQDIYTKKLYPAFNKFDPSTDGYEYNEGKILKQSKGSTQEIYMTLIEPKNIFIKDINKPDEEDIFELIQKKSDLNNLKKQDALLQLIQYVDGGGTLCYLATTIYVEKHSSDLEDISVMDPFGSDKKAFWLKDSLVEASSRNEQLKKIFNNLLTDAKKEKSQQLSEALKEIHKEAAEIVESTFGYSLRLYDKLYMSLEELYRDLKTYEYQKKKNGKYLKEALKNSQTVLETLFDYIYIEHKNGYIDALNISSLNNLDPQVVKAKTLKMCPQSEIPEWKFRTFKGLKQAMANKGNSLRPKYIAAILATWHDRKNSMFDLMCKKNDLLVFLEKVSDGRNAVGHSYKEIQDEEIGKYYNEVLQIILGIEEIIRIYLERK